MKNLFKLKLEVNDEDVIKFKECDPKKLEKKLFNVFKKYK